ncbi:hypothetical protein [Raoultella terrigena]|uniref:hypothetical protein n=1 Tax=Raoultella terrigena TaxID=577 RepID=UPI001F454966|nr:hypothetical protein [Raoultella terrigena]
MTYFKDLENEIPTIKKLSIGAGVNSFYAQEVLRFYSIAGTLSNQFDLNNLSSVEERYISHILSRSLLENYFWILYIFDDKNEKIIRYESLLDSFRKDYYKLMNEPMINNQSGLEPADPSWSSISRGLDVNSMLAQIKNDYGDRLNYLYFTYRISSFDTHGKNLSTVLESVFGKRVNFPYLKLEYAFELISNQYLIILGELRSNGEIQ